MYTNRTFVYLGNMNSSTTSLHFTIRKQNFFLLINPRFAGECTASLILPKTPGTYNYGQVYEPVSKQIIRVYFTAHDTITATNIPSGNYDVLIHGFDM